MQTIDAGPVPIEYVAFAMCREFGWTPDQVDALPKETFWLYHGFLLAEAEAGRMRALQSQHYAR